MHPLTADEFIRVWELGQRQDPAEQAVTLLTAAFPEKGGEELRGLTLGQRNAALLDMREQLFGTELSAFSECLNCGERLEFTLSSGAIREEDSMRLPNTEFELEAEGYALRFRLLNGSDVRAAAACRNVEAARKLLVARTVIEASFGGEPVSSGDLPETVVERLAAQLSERDPQAEVMIDLECPVCNTSSRVWFEIGSFFYAEIRTLAERLMREVHALARGYAWSEKDILSMNPLRRQYYLEMLGQ
jgi:hypothetical protein